MCQIWPQLGLAGSLWDAMQCRHTCTGLSCLQNAAMLQLPLSFAAKQRERAGQAKDAKVTALIWNAPELQLQVKLQL